MITNNFKDKLNIIIAEDNSINLFFLKTLIRMNFPQINIFEAETGDKVLELLKKKTDLLILDLTLPMNDGFEIIQYMKADEILEKTPIIVLSATDSKKIEMKLNTFGIKSYLRKPATKEAILDAINRHLFK